MFYSLDLKAFYISQIKILVSILIKEGFLMNEKNQKEMKLFEGKSIFKKQLDETLNTVALLNTI